MPRKATLVEQPDPVEPSAPVPVESQWTGPELAAVSHLGPGVIGREMYEASQAYMKASAGGILGPATRGE